MNVAVGLGVLVAVVFVAILIVGMNSRGTAAEEVVYVQRSPVSSATEAGESVAVTQTSPPVQAQQQSADARPVPLRPQGPLRVEIPFGQIFWPMVCAQIFLAILGAILYALLRA